MAGPAEQSFEEHLAQVNLAGARLGYVLAALLVPATSLLDWVSYPSHAARFMAIRILSSLVLFCLVLFSFNKTAERHPVLLGAGPPLICAVAIELMIVQIGGAASPYYAGLTLCILAVAVLYTWRWHHALAVSSGIVLIWLLPAAAQAVSGAFEFRPFFNNLFFLVLTAVIAVTSTVTRYRSAYRSHVMRASLADTSQKLATTLERLQELDRLKNEFFANVSHELRTPLTLILAPVDDLLTRSLPEATSESLLIVRRNAQRLLRMIDDLLDLARLDVGGLRLRIAELSWPDVARRVAEAARPAAAARSIELSFENDGTDPDLCGDPHRLEIVLTNLVANALKFTPDGGRIRVRAGVSGKVAFVEVEDTGSGIPEAALPRIFDRFYQVEGSARRRHGGAGIGLALAKRLVELHGGRIMVTSRVGHGSTFRVELPLGRDHFRDEAIERRRVRTEAHPGRRAEDRAVLEPSFEAAPPLVNQVRPATPVRLDRGRRARVIVAEDEPDLRDFIVSVLRQQFDVVAAADGAEALELVQRERPDLVVTDVMMPGVSGTDLCRAIKQDQGLRSTPVVLLTALSSTDNTLDGYAAGADDFVTKPFHPRVLVARIEAQLRLRALSIQLADQSRLSTAGTLAAGLAHEVKNPINAVLNAARLLPSVATKPETAEKLLRVILEGIQRIEETVSLLEEHVRPAEGGALVTCDLRAGLDSSLRLLEHKMNGIALHTSYGSTRQVVASARALNQVFLNLLDNAVRATPTNIWVSAADTDRGVKVTIADDGQGIPPETALLIFEPFFTTRELGEGTGLGLYLCRRIVQDSGGELRYQPRAGGGAEFTIELRSMVAAA